ncbi:MAG TPA: hypothetical protein GXX75_05620 [Clostridiales bacterium]|nr:hypothetical protein [Clostridiales bacterium]
MNIKQWIVFCILFISIILSACKPTVLSGEPEIKSSFTITTLTNQDFESINAEGFEKDDFRKVDFLLEVNNSESIENRSISVPDFTLVMNSYDIERYWFGQYTISDSPGRNALYSNNIMFLSRDLSNDEIRSVFKDEKIVITWTNKNGEEKENIIHLTDIISFE